MDAAPALDPTMIRKIMVRAVNWIGDAVMTTPALGDLRAAFPHSEIVVVANPVVSELFDPHPHCDRVLKYDKKGKHRGPRGFLKFCSELRSERFDAAILFQNALEAALMSFFAGIPVRAGYRTDGRTFFLTHGVPVGGRERLLHHTEYYRHMLRTLGISGGDGELRLTVTESEVQWAESLLGTGVWVAINPGAAYGSAKRWYPERFARVADELARKHRVHIVLTGGPSEVPLGEAIVGGMALPAVNLMGRTNVRQMAAVLSRCVLAITNDSGPMHVAAALGLPVVALFGPTDPGTTSPRTRRFHLLSHPVECGPCLKRQCPTDHRCMLAIGTDEVIQAAETFLDEAVLHEATAKP